MTGIEELRERVLQAEQRFGVIDEQHAKYSGRLITLMNAIEGRFREQQSEIEQQSEEIVRQGKEVAELSGRLTRAAGENEQLRAMLHSLLKAIEGGQSDTLADTMLSLDRTVSTLMQGSAQEAGLNAAPLEPVDIAPLPSAVTDSPDEEAVAEEPEVMPDPAVEELAGIAADVQPKIEDTVETADEIARAEEPITQDTVADDELAMIDGPPEAPHFFDHEEFAAAAVADDEDVVAEQVDPGDAIDEATNAEEIVTAEDATDSVTVDDVGEHETIVEQVDPEETLVDETSESRTPQPCTLDEIMRRVSRLVEEADAVGFPDSAEDSASDDPTAESDSGEAADRAAAAS